MHDFYELRRKQMQMLDCYAQNAEVKHINRGCRRTKASYAGMALDFWRSMSSTTVLSTRVYKHYTNNYACTKSRKE